MWGPQGEMSTAGSGSFRRNLYLAHGLEAAYMPATGVDLEVDAVTDGAKRRHLLGERRLGREGIGGKGLGREGKQKEDALSMVRLRPMGIR